MWLRRVLGTTIALAACSAPVAPPLADDGSRPVDGGALSEGGEAAAPADAGPLPRCDGSLVTVPGLTVPGGNEDSSLTWGTSYLLMGYAASVRAAAEQDPALFERRARELVVVADRVLQARDSARGVAHRLPVWSSTNYTGGVPYATVVSTGMIGYPLADFAALVRERADLAARRACGTRTFGEIADGYAAALVAAVKAHHHEWNSVTGSYRAPAYSSPWFKDSQGRALAGFAELPTNQFLAMGRLQLMLYRATGDPWLRLMAHDMGLRLKASLRTSGNGLAYEWPYWSAGPDVEDHSHGAIDVDFARLCHEAGIVFSGEDLSAFARTFTKNLYKGGGDLALFVDGSRASLNRDRDWAFLWLPLSRFDPQTADIVLELRRLAPPASSTAREAGRLMLDRWGGRRIPGENCARDSECSSTLCAEGACASGPAGTGSPCRRSVECLSGFCDRAAAAPGRCAAPPPPTYPAAKGLAAGAACTEHIECLSKVCALRLGGGPGRCGALQPVGAPCVDLDDAETGLCVGGVVAPR